MSQTKKDLIQLIVASWTAMFIIGIGLGFFMSPNFDSKTTVKSILSNQLQVVECSNSVRTMFPCNEEIISYDCTLDSILTFPNPFFSPEVHRNGYSLDEWQGVITVTGALGGFGFNSLLKRMNLKIITKGSKSKILIAGAMLSGIVVGYYIGYNDTYDCENSIIQEVIFDKGFWQAAFKKSKYQSIEERESFWEEIYSTGTPEYSISTMEFVRHWDYMGLKNDSIDILMSYQGFSYEHYNHNLYDSLKGKITRHNQEGVIEFRPNRAKNTENE